MDSRAVQRAACAGDYALSVLHYPFYFSSSLFQCRAVVFSSCVLYLQFTKRFECQLLSNLQGLISCDVIYWPNSGKFHHLPLFVRDGVKADTMENLSMFSTTFQSFNLQVIFPEYFS